MSKDEKWDDVPDMHVLNIPEVPTGVKWLLSTVISTQSLHIRHLEQVEEVSTSVLVAPELWVKWAYLLGDQILP